MFERNVLRNVPSMRPRQPAGERPRPLIGRRVLVAARSRVAYVPIPKASSTSMLWMLARAEGDPDARLADSIRGSGPSQVIHDPLVHRLPRLGAVSARRRAEVLRSAEWTRMALTRDPYERFFSAWQFRVLIRGPGPPKFELPDLVVDGSGNLDVTASFRQFVRFTDDHWASVMSDPHFLPQVPMLCLDDIDYTHLVPLDDMACLIDHLRCHAPHANWDPGRVNEGLGVDMRRCYDEESIGIVGQRYAADIDMFGARRVDLVDDPLLLDATGRRLLDLVHDRHQRIRSVQLAASPMRTVRRTLRQLAVDRDDRRSRR
jgi:hypothetical protein